MKKIVLNWWFNNYKEQKERFENYKSDSSILMGSVFLESIGNCQLYFYKKTRIFQIQVTPDLKFDLPEVNKYHES